ncbi:MAG TPA: hypothetical protein VEV41_07840 [Terriglobales bacterium]|nr:hypothetical protein [Terriglobales bacterium]
MAKSFTVNEYKPVEENAITWQRTALMCFSSKCLRIRIHAMVRRRSFQKRLARATLAQETAVCRIKEIDEI